MNILMVASEATPLIKVGGLADVVGALPGALVAVGQDVRVLLPRYGALHEHGFVDQPTGVAAAVPWRGRAVRVEVFVGRLPDSATPLYALSAAGFFDGGAYVQDSSPDGLRRQLERFAFFSWAAAHLIPNLDWPPDIVHCHDWHAAGLPVFMNATGNTSVPSVVTIHNIESQGKWSPNELLSWLGLRGDETPTLAARDVMGDFNLLQQGVLAADAVTTVSPTYAQEVLRPEYGFGLETTLRERSDGIVGIVNGLDTVRFNPATDRHLVRPFSVATAAAGKDTNRSALAKLCGWSNERRPILGVVSRLTEQKGLGLLLEALPVWFAGGGRLVVLGTGQPGLEERLVAAAAAQPGSMAVRLGFDAAAAQKIYGGADFFAMPSRFEPCGLGQLIAMRYGGLPIVHDTGGLHDTVIDYPTNPDRGTGFVFADFSASMLGGALRAALRLWSKPDILEAVRRRAMSQDFSWAASAAKYLHLYAALKK